MGVNPDHGKSSFYTKGTIFDEEIEVKCSFLSLLFLSFLLEMMETLFIVFKLMFGRIAA